MTADLNHADTAGIAIERERERERKSGIGRIGVSALTPAAARDGVNFFPLGGRASRKPVSL